MIVTFAVQIVLSSVVSVVFYAMLSSVLSIIIPSVVAMTTDRRRREFHTLHSFSRHTPSSQVISHGHPLTLNRSPPIVKSFQNEICVSNVRRREDRLTSVGSLIKRRLRLPARYSVCPPVRSLATTTLAPPAHFGLMAPCLLTGV